MESDNTKQFPTPEDRRAKMPEIDNVSAPNARSFHRSMTSPLQNVRVIDNRVLVGNCSEIICRTQGDAKALASNLTLDKDKNIIRFTK